MNDKNPQQPVHANTCTGMQIISLKVLYILGVAYPAHNFSYLHQSIHG